MAEWWEIGPLDDDDERTISVHEMLIEKNMRRPSNFIDEVKKDKETSFEELNEIREKHHIFNEDDDEF